MNRAQQIKNNKSFNDRTDIEIGVPRGSVSGSLFFSIDMTGLFHDCEDSGVVGYADHIIPHSCATDILSVALELQASVTKLGLKIKI